MRVLYVAPRHWPSVGGAQLLARELARRMAARHSVMVVAQFVTDHGSFAKALANAVNLEYEDDGISVRHIGPTGPWRMLLRMMGELYERTRAIRPAFAIMLDRAVRPQLERAIRDFRPHVVHAVHVGLMYSSEMAYRAARRWGLPFIWTPFPHIEGGGVSNRWGIYNQA